MILYFSSSFFSKLISILSDNLYFISNYKINAKNTKTFGELYQKTLEREQLIRDLGYNLVVMWEYDWKRLNILIKILQRKFRSNR